jgi:hypothetical protein
MNNYIGIDISLNSTAIYLESDRGNKILSLNNKKDNNIYIKELDRCGVEFIHLNAEKSKIYSDNEILKLRHFDKIATLVLDFCLKNINEDENTFCQIEGYSFSKNTSSILDIVSLSTLIRVYLLKNIKNIDISIISPSSLKLEACKLSYDPVDIGVKKPKYIYVNNEGVSGGSFKKPEMYKALLDSKLSIYIRDFLVEYKHLTERSKIPNPIEDIIDAIFACKVKIKQVENNIKW